MKGYARRNTHVKYESTSTYRSIVVTKDKDFEKKAKLQGQRSEGQGHDIKR
jgi:predicted nuclease of predicted toxin-antitoxin system